MKAITTFLAGGVMAIVVLLVTAFEDIEKVTVDAYDIFEGTSPCASAAKSFLQIPASDKCEYVKWHLVLNYEAQTKKPSDYTLTREYLYYIDNSTSKSQGTVTIKGKWEMVTGIASLPEATVYKLHDGDRSLNFIKADENLIHLLAPDNSFAAEASVESFTLSRTNSKLAATGKPMKISRPLSNEKQSMLKFVGRTPCEELATEINMQRGADCNKLKWLLKLYLNPSMQQPSGYELSATFHRQSILKGKWEMVKGRPADPDAIIYKIHLGKPYESILLLKADDNVLFFLDRNLNPLVGNAQFSYTLSRAE
jgi:hypothetical protein